MILTIVAFISILSWAELVTNATLPACRLNMLGFNVSSKVEAGLGGVVTVRASVVPIVQPGHLCPDCRRRISLKTSN